MELTNSWAITFLITFKVALGSRYNETSWKKSVSDKNSAFDKFKLAVFVPSTATCMSICSQHKDLDACTFNSDSKECRIFDKEDRGNRIIESGTQLWIRTDCRLDFVKVPGFQQCIKYFPKTNDVDWSRAKTECESINAKLVIVDTRAKLDGLIKYVEDLSDAEDAYVGADDTYVESQGSNTDFAAFDSTSPSPVDSGDCLLYDKNRKELKKHTCDHEHAYICQNS